MPRRWTRRVTKERASLRLESWAPGVSPARRPELCLHLACPAPANCSVATSAAREGGLETLRLPAASTSIPTACVGRAANMQPRAMSSVEFVLAHCSVGAKCRPGSGRRRAWLAWVYWTAWRALLCGVSTCQDPASTLPFTGLSVYGLTHNFAGI